MTYYQVEFQAGPSSRLVPKRFRTEEKAKKHAMKVLGIADGGSLDNQYTVVGEVVSGMDVVDKLKRGEPPSEPDRIVKMQVAADVK